MSDAAKWVQPLFPDDRIPQILRILLRCLAGLQKEHHLELETRLSKKLLSRIRRDSEIRDAPFWPYRELVEDDEETGDESRFDISFILLNELINPPPYFLIEAKRLHVDFESGWKPLVPQYVTGHQGMMSFVDGRYSKGRLTSAAMLGYVFDGDVAKARTAISNHILLNHPKLKSLPPHGLAPCRIAIADVDETRHDFDGREFTLYHILAAV